MTLIIKYFGMVAEASCKKEEVLEFNNLPVQNLRNDLLKKYPRLATVDFKIAVNQSFVNDNFVLTGSEEVALLPPFAGG